MSETPYSGLSPDQIDHFIEHGYLKLENAFDADLARAGQEELWRAMGLSPDAPQTWTRPVVRLNFMSSPLFVAAANTPRLHQAYDALVGEGRWLRPQGLGTFAVRFPSPEDPGDAGWHVDASFGTDNPDFMQWRVNVKSRGRALLMLFLFSNAGDLDAPTRIRKGSHLHIALQLLPFGEEGLTLGELAADDFAPPRPARKCWRPALPARFISATPSSCMRPSRTAGPGRAFWRNLPCCPAAHLIPPCRPHRCKGHPPGLRPANLSALSGPARRAGPKWRSLAVGIQSGPRPSPA